MRARAGNYEVDSFIELLGILFDEAKDDLVTAAPEEFARVQGAAVTYRTLLNMLTRPNPALPKG